MAIHPDNIVIASYFYIYLSLQPNGTESFNDYIIIKGVNNVDADDDRPWAQSVLC